MRFLLGAVAGGVIYAILPDSLKADLNSWLGVASLWLGAVLAEIGLHLTAVRGVS